MKRPLSDCETGDTHRQPKASGAGAAGIDEQHALSFLHQGPMGVAGDDRGPVITAGRLLQFLEIM